MKTLLTIILLTLFSQLCFGAVPAINLEDINLTNMANGSKYSVPQDKNKVLVVFWATWCSTCKQKLVKTLPDMMSERKNLEIITINTDKDVRRVKSYIDKNGVKMTVLRDEEKKLIDPLKVVTAPHWALFEKKDNHFALLDAAEAFDTNKIESHLK